MERTESTVIQVSPDWENEKIKEMEAFGWNLQSRQEMHQEGDAYGRPSLTGNSYIIKTKVSHYVKLHFVRSLSLPNLDGIRRVESDYSSIAFPNVPSLAWPIGLTAFGVIGIIIGFFPRTPGGLIPFYIVWVALFGFWTRSRFRKRAAAQAIVQQNLLRMDQLRKEATSLTASH